jgi:hypothetical protein
VTGCTGNSYQVNESGSEAIFRHGFRLLNP